jgi:hypothetical protein
MKIIRRALGREKALPRTGSRLIKVFGKGTASGDSENLTNVCNTVEQRRFSAALSLQN